jgi:hypothetical protein
MSFVEEVFETQFAPHLSLGDWSGRTETFRAALSLLEAEKREKTFIVETGTCRQPLEADFWTNGASTLIFDKYLEYHDGSCHSIDIDSQLQAQVRSQLSKKSILICKDSILGLRELTPSLERIDLLYLDSMDLCWIAPETSAVHHLKELAVSLASLRSGSLVLIDDSPRSEEWLPPWAANWSQPIWEIIPPEARLK